MARPAGVTTIAVLCLLVASWGVANVARLLARGQFMKLFFREQQGGATTNQAELGVVLVFEIVVFTALYAIAGLGLWKLRNWGRVLTIVLVTLGAAFDLLQLFLAGHFLPSTILTGGLTLALYATLAWYLSKPAIKAAFTSTDERRRGGTREKGTA